MYTPNKAFGKRSTDIACERVPARHCFQKVAILVDGDFFIRRLKTISSPNTVIDVPTILASLRKLMHEHLKYTGRELYRLFFYDCHPLSDRRHLPVSNKCINYAETEQYKLRSQLHYELKHQRKCALRLGYLLDNKDTRWVLKG